MNIVIIGIDNFTLNKCNNLHLIRELNKIPPKN